jgi:hypothetical protein
VKGIDVKDIKLGFWIGAGLALFSLIMGLLMSAVSRARGGDRGR